MGSAGFLSIFPIVKMNLPYFPIFAAILLYHQYFLLIFPHAQGNFEFQHFLRCNWSELILQISGNFGVIRIEFIADNDFKKCI